MTGSPALSSFVHPVLAVKPAIARRIVSLIPR